MINEKNLVKELRKIFKGQRFGIKIYCLKNCFSTNDKALSLAKNKAPDGTIVVALKQKMGRGRFGRTWVTEKGGLALSFILRPKFNINEVYRIIFLSASAIISCLDEFKIKTKLKWPNDVMMAKKNGHYSSNFYGKYVKVAGILIELVSCKEHIDAIVVGIGLNVNRPFKNNAFGFIKNVGFLDDAKKMITIEAVLYLLLQKLEQKLAHVEDVNFFLFELNKLRSECLTLGHKVTVGDNKDKISGLAIAINDDGSLSIKKNDGQICKIYANDVHIIS